MKVLSWVMYWRKRFDGSRSVDDVAMRGIGEQFVDVVGAESEVAFAQDDESVSSNCAASRQAAIDAAAVAGLLLVKGQGASPLLVRRSHPHYCC